MDPKSHTTLNRQVYGSIREAILNGRLKSGDRLPATRALAGQLALSRTTVAEAYDQLQAEGYLQGRHGSGTYVASNLPEDGLKPAGSVPASNGHVERTPRLSRWGKRVIEGQYQLMLRPEEHSNFDYDLRPHLIAQDSFPWDAWRASVERALSADRGRLLSYPPSAGHPDLREAIAEHVRRYRAVTCTVGQIVIVNGSQQGLNLLTQLTLDPDDRVAVEDPGYPSARVSFEASGFKVTRVPVDEDGMIVSCLDRAGVHRMIHVTPSHQEPTGATLSLGRRLSLLEIAERTDCLVVEDDYDSEFRYEGSPVESLQGLDQSGLVVYAGTFSKSILSGLRIGFLVLPLHLIGPFTATKSLWDSGAPMLEQAALAEFMRSGSYERHIRRMRRLYRARRDGLVSALSDVFGEKVTVGVRHGGLNVLVKFDTGLNDLEIIRSAREIGVGLRSASRYYSEQPVVPTFLMGFGAMREDKIREGVVRLGQALQEARAAG